MGRLYGKVGFLTGGGAGIAKCSAIEFIKEGAQVAIVDINEAVGRKAEADIRAAGGDALFIQADVTQEADVKRAVEAAVARFGKLDILVNNAATNPYAGPIIDCDTPRWDKTHEVNLRGPLVWTQAAWRGGMKQHGGCVINISSVGGFRTNIALGVYDIFKCALIHMTEQLAAELAPKVRVNCLAPGLIKTDFAKYLWEDGKGDHVAQRYPLKRLGEPDDIGEAALYLAAGASWVTGQTIVLDGGGLIRFAD